MLHRISFTPYKRNAHHPNGPPYFWRRSRWHVKNVWSRGRSSICKILQQKEHLDRCRQIIYGAFSDSAIGGTQYVNDEVINETWIRHHFNFNTFSIFAILGDFSVPTAHTGDSARRVNSYSHDIQRTFYSGYLHAHRLKAQVVYLPIGLVGSVFITEIRQNDNGVQNISGLNDYVLMLVAGILIDDPMDRDSTPIAARARNSDSASAYDAYSIWGL